MQGAVGVLLPLIRSGLAPHVPWLPKSVKSPVRSPREAAAGIEVFTGVKLVIQ
jgi:hypothetical protein